MLATGEGRSARSELAAGLCPLRMLFGVHVKGVIRGKDSIYQIKATELRKMASNEAACLTVWVKASTTATDYTIPFRLSHIARN